MLFQIIRKGIPKSWLSTDNTFAADSDKLVPSQKAIKAYITTQLGSLADALIFKGVIDCSTNPNYPAANAGDTYKISVAGKIGGASGKVVEVNDMIICTHDSTASGDEATVGIYWVAIQNNIDGAWTGTGLAQISGLGEKTAIVDDDNFVLDDSEASNLKKRGKLSTLKAIFKKHINIRYIQAVVFDFGTDVATGDGKFYLHIPPDFNGMNLTSVHALVITAGTTDTTDIQIANVTDAVDMLSTKLTIDSGETGSDTAATPAVIDTTKDDVATNDVLRIDVDAVSTTKPKGLIVTLGFQTP